MNKSKKHKQRNLGFIAGVTFAVILSLFSEALWELANQYFGLTIAMLIVVGLLILIIVILFSGRRRGMKRPKVSLAIV